jgi:hypothetical protein
MPIQYRKQGENEKKIITLVQAVSILQRVAQIEKLAK